MSAIQNSVRPILTPLIKGNGGVLTASDQETLATWITMVTFTGEFLSPEAAMIPREEREQFFWKRCAFPGWVILVGLYDDQFYTVWHQKRSSLLGSLETLRLRRRPPENVQTSTIVIGHFVALAFSVYIPGRWPLAIPFPLNGKVFQIHPRSDNLPLALSMANAMDDNDVSILSSALVTSYPPL